jgi:hypothetical protein
MAATFLPRSPHSSACNVIVTLQASQPDALIVVFRSLGALEIQPNTICPGRTRPRKGKTSSKSTILRQPSAPPIGHPPALSNSLPRQPQPPIPPSPHRTSRIASSRCSWRLAWAPTSVRRQHPACLDRPEPLGLGCVAPLQPRRTGRQHPRCSRYPAQDLQSAGRLRRERLANVTAADRRVRMQPYFTTVTSIRDGCRGVCQMRCVCAWKSEALALKMFRTQTCGFRS